MDKATIKKLVDQIVPMTKRKAAYRKIAAAIIDNPSITYPAATKETKVQMKDPAFYTFRAKLLKAVGKNGKSSKSVASNKRGYQKYNPPSDVLIREALKENSAMSNAELSRYVCTRQKRKNVVTLSGSMISAAKKELGIAVQVTSRGKNQDIVQILFERKGQISDEAKTILQDFIEQFNAKCKREIEIKSLEDGIEVREKFYV